MRIIRVFPRKTRATPVESDTVYIGMPDMYAEADKIEVSVSFTWDIPLAELLARNWGQIAPVEIGGPAVGTRGGEFIPGHYLKEGYVITSRGCPNRCWFCKVWQRDGIGKELQIRQGWNVLDDNLLACSERHVRAVFAMLEGQAREVSFTGGLEAARLEDWHVDLLASLRPRPNLFFAYDTPDDWEPLVVAASKIFASGFTAASHRVRCYVLIGGSKDTFAEAETRLKDTLHLGLTPMAMLYRGPSGRVPPVEWRRFARIWARPAIIHSEKGKCVNGRNEENGSV